MSDYYPDFSSLNTDAPDLSFDPTGGTSVSEITVTAAPPVDVTTSNVVDFPIIDTSTPLITDLSTVFAQPGTITPSQTGPSLGSKILSDLAKLLKPAATVGKPALSAGGGGGAPMPSAAGKQTTTTTTTTKSLAPVELAIMAVLAISIAVIIKDRKSEQ